MYYINKDTITFYFLFLSSIFFNFQNVFLLSRGPAASPCQIPERKYFNKRFSTEAGESKLKGGNTRTAMIKHPNGQFDIGD